MFQISMNLLDVVETKLSIKCQQICMYFTSNTIIILHLLFQPFFLFIFSYFFFFYYQVLSKFQQLAIARFTFTVYNVHKKNIFSIILHSQNLQLYHKETPIRVSSYKHRKKFQHFLFAEDYGQQFLLLSAFSIQSLQFCSSKHSTTGPFLSMSIQNCYPPRKFCWRSGK